MAMYVLNAERKDWANSFRRDVMSAFKAIGLGLCTCQIICGIVYFCNIFISDDWINRVLFGFSTFAASAFAWWIWVALKEVN